MIFPKDAKTVTGKVINVNTQTVITDIPNTVLSIRLQQSGSQSETVITCGSTGQELAHNYAKDYSLDLIQFVCNDNVIVDKTGSGDEAFFTITYVPYDLNKSASNTPSIANGFIYGDIIISVLLFMTFMTVFFGFIWNKLNKK